MDYKNDERYWNIKLLNKWFAISSILFFISIAWMFLDDNDDEFKNYQKQFRQLQAQLNGAIRGVGGRGDGAMSQVGIDPQGTLAYMKDNLEHGLNDYKRWKKRKNWEYDGYKFPTYNYYLRFLCIKYESSKCKKTLDIYEKEIGSFKKNKFKNIRPIRSRWSN